jgi:hypothetical protein
MTAGIPGDPTSRPGIGVGHLISEAEAYQEYGRVLEDKELRRARAAGLLGYLRRKRKIFYRRDELEEFIRRSIEEEFVPCKRTQPRRAPVQEPLPSPDPAERPVQGGSLEEELRRLALARLAARPGH